MWRCLACQSNFKRMESGYEFDEDNDEWFLVVRCPGCLKEITREIK